MSLPPVLKTPIGLSLLKTIPANFAAFFYPYICEICGDVQSSTDLLCHPCLDRLDNNFHARKPCPRCGQNLNIVECLCHIACDLHIEDISALFDYDDDVRVLAHALKYRGAKALGRFIGRSFHKLLPSGYFDGFDLICPVPMHSSFTPTRRYNQSEVLAKGFLCASGSSVPIENLLERSRRSPSQTRLSREARKKNQEGAFRIRHGMQMRIRGKKILIVDDIVTTGATVDSCAEILLSAGAASVGVFCLARD